MPRLKRPRVLRADVLVGYNEQIFKSAFVEAANADGAVFLWRQQAGATRVKRGYLHLAPEGAADLTGYVVGTGRHVEVEAKDENGAQKPSQVEWQAEVEAAGAFYFLAKPMKREPLTAAVRRCVAELRAQLAEAEKVAAAGDVALAVKGTQ